SLVPLLRQRGVRRRQGRCPARPGARHPRARRRAAGASDAVRLPWRSGGGGLAPPPAGLGRGRRRLRRPRAQRARAARSAAAARRPTRAEQQPTTTERDAPSRLGLAEAQLLAGRLEKAAPLAERTLALATEHDERANQGYALRLLAEIAAQRQPPEWEEAMARYRQALALSSDIGMRPLAAHCHLGLSRVYRRLDRSADAEMHRMTAITMYRE